MWCISVYVDVKDLARTKQNENVHSQELHRCVRILYVGCLDLFLETSNRFPCSTQVACGYVCLCKSFLWIEDVLSLPRVSIHATFFYRFKLLCSMIWRQTLCLVKERSRHFDESPCSPFVRVAVLVECIRAVEAAHAKGQLGMHDVLRGRAYSTSESE